MTSAATPVRKLFTLLLVVLLAVFMTAEVAHSHPTGTVDLSSASHCQLCAIAHIGTVAQPAWLTAHIQHLIGVITLAEPSLQSRLTIPTAFIRPPPPVALALA